MGDEIEIVAGPDDRVTVAAVVDDSSESNKAGGSTLALQST
jgi:hypothetical protein